MDSVEQETEKLGEESLRNVEIKTNRITGNIEVSSDKMLVFAIPYSDGFTAYIDGKKTELVKADSMYMGVELKKGKHSIVTYLPYIVSYSWNGADSGGAWSFSSDHDV